MVSALCGLALVAGGSTALSAAGQGPATVKVSKLSLAGIPQHDETLGNPRAPVKMVYFNDPASPLSLEWQTYALSTLVRKYVRTGKLQIQWQGIDAIGPMSVTGEQFIAAAGRQNHLWETLLDVMANQGKTTEEEWLTRPLLEAVGAKVTGLDVERAMADASSSSVARELALYRSRFTAAGFDGVPAILLGRAGRRPSRRYVGFKVSNVRQFESPINRLLRHPRR